MGPRPVLLRGSTGDSVLKPRIKAAMGFKLHVTMVSGELTQGLILRTVCLLFTIDEQDRHRAFHY